MRQNDVYSNILLPAAAEYFFRARILLILQSKINKIRALKKYSLAA